MVLIDNFSLLLDLLPSAAPVRCSAPRLAPSLTCTRTQ